MGAFNTPALFIIMKQLELPFMKKEKEGFNPTIPIVFTQEDLNRIHQQELEIRKILDAQTRSIESRSCPCCRRY